MKRVMALLGERVTSFTAIYLRDFSMSVYLPIMRFVY